MQKTFRIGEHQLGILAAQAKVENTNCGPLYRRNIDSTKWQLKWFALQHNLLYCYDAEGNNKLNGCIILEGCFAEEIVLAAVKGRKQYGFAIYLLKDQSKLFELRTETEGDLRTWLECLNEARYAKLQENKEQLEQKHLHLTQVLEAESHAKWHSMRQIEELSEENQKLKSELRRYKAEVVNTQREESTEIRKIKKVQSFFRGWLCRRRWKQIVELYIKSPHAESMRTRNNVVFGMVEDEEEYVKNISTLVTCFLRPLRMAASSKKPLISHDDVSSIFLNSETVLFLHQIFLKGLTARVDNWPTLVIGDLFDMLLPMLGIYQEYVRNHHYSLQVLAEYKQRPEFNQLLKRFEEKPSCENRVLETFLTYPMHQIPKYILALHELLAHTPYEHIERKKLEYAKGKLEELSLAMHDEVSETENIRKNLAIERMITEGCDILLDTSQVFVRQGNLLQVSHDKSRYSGLRLTGFKEKEVQRRVLLFTHHLLIANRTSNGRLHLAKNYGKLPLAQCTLIEDTCADIATAFDEDGNHLPGYDGNVLQAFSASLPRVSASWALDFRIIVHSRDKEVLPISLTFVASSLHEKSAWCSDISQCMENLHYTDMLGDSLAVSTNLPQSVRMDHKLFKDDSSVKYCRTVNNSCKIPQIRHATVDKLLERLIDLRFLSIDFLNTFLLTYKVFTDSEIILKSLRSTVIESCLTRETDQTTYKDDAESLSSTSSLCVQDIVLEKISNSSESRSGLEQNKEEVRLMPQPVTSSGVENSNNFLSINPSTKRERTYSFEYIKNVDPIDEDYLLQNRSSANPNLSSSSSETTSDSDSPPSHNLALYFREQTKPQLDNVFIDFPPNDDPKVSKANNKHVRETSKSPGSSRVSSPRLAVTSHKLLEATPRTGGVITSSRLSRRRCSSSAATTAFAAATAGAASATCNRHSSVGIPVTQCKPAGGTSTAIMRALNVLRHWVAKFPQNFRQDAHLSTSMRNFLEELIVSSSLIAAEQKLASNILKTLNKELEEQRGSEHLKLILDFVPHELPSHGTFEEIAAIDIAEQLTYLDHHIFMSVSSEELLGQAWMKADKIARAPHVIQASQRFNEVSQLVVTEIVSKSSILDRVNCIEKWAAIADILHCMHNYNGTLQICAAFVNSSIYRLSKTWEMLTKQTKQTISKLQMLVSSDGRFKNMREALHKCDSACVPYLGMYLSDLNFIEESSPNFVEDGLVNYSKMRMISNVIREVQQYQQQAYSISYSAAVCSYLLDRSMTLSDEQTYRLSLSIEPRADKTRQVSRSKTLIEEETG
ncbi:ras-specific guanine nucleotide-releasing factor 2-like [Watersipora subatra]|uniref:ras-specific guanine nucleotide-releasing factor 2-like n=1 Tax=Watersipora subatra TaxID=2589382 RepID=UPI00355B022A